MPSDVRLWTGDSSGHWEGDTLVVDTTNFTSKTRFRGSDENLRHPEVSGHKSGAARKMN
jgi:hypothetical protein